MTIKTTSARAAAKDRHLSRQKGGRNPPKGGAGRHNWGADKDIDDQGLPTKGPFYDEEVDLDSLQNADSLREDPKVRAAAL